MLTPSDIEQKTFHTSLRGYDLDEVDDFLDEVVATIRELTEKLNSVEAAPAKQTAPSDESAVGRALVAAQTTADQMIADAEAEAEKILEEAKTEAENWATERDEKKAAAEQEMAELSQHVAQVRNQLAVLATAVADRLDEMDEALSMESSDLPEDSDEGLPMSGDGEAEVMPEADDSDDGFHADEALSSDEEDHADGEPGEEQGEAAEGHDDWN